jgi:type II secretory pathway pseudopilin PulG
MASLSQPSPRAGFTLIEVTLGLSILILIFGVIFQLVQMSMLGANEATQLTRRNREVDGLFALVRQLCLDLPFRSQVLLEPGAGAGQRTDLVLSNASAAIFPDRFDGTRVLRLELRKSEGETGSNLRLVEVFQPKDGTGAQTNLFPLMREITDLRWWALDTRDGQEKTEWNDSVKPACLRMELTRRQGNRREKFQGLFWIPTGLGPGGLVPLDPVTLQGQGMTEVTNPPGGPTPGTPAPGVPAPGSPAPVR